MINLLTLEVDPQLSLPGNQQDILRLTGKEFAYTDKHCPRHIINILTHTWTADFIDRYIQVCGDMNTALYVLRRYVPGVRTLEKECFSLESVEWMYRVVQRYEEGR